MTDKKAKPRSKTKSGTRKTCGARSNQCGVDIDVINETVCQLEAMTSRLDANTVAIFEFTKCLAKRCKVAKIPVEVWLGDEIRNDIQLGFAHLLNQGNIPVVRDVEGECVSRRHDSTVSCYRGSKLPLHHADPIIQVAAMPHLNTLFVAVLDEAEKIATALDEARAFDCTNRCCPFTSGCS